MNILPINNYVFINDIKLDKNFNDDFSNKYYTGVVINPSENCKFVKEKHIDNARVLFDIDYLLNFRNFAVIAEYNIIAILEEVKHHEF